jgi:hypothetical protein
MPAESYFQYNFSSIFQNIIVQLNQQLKDEPEKKKKND